MYEAVEPVMANTKKMTAICQLDVIPQRCLSFCIIIICWANILKEDSF